MTSSNVAMCAPNVKLSEIAQAANNAGATCELRGEDVAAQGVQTDSRKVAPGNLFICKGAHFVPAFLTSAVENGAVAFLCQGERDVAGKLSVPAELAAAAGNTPCLVAENVRHAMAFASAAAYNTPAAKLHITGITGTKGKTTTSFMLHAIMKAAGIDTSILGSIETDDGVELFESCNTTPESPDLQRHLFNTVCAGRKHMVMEVSSQALKYDRVAGLKLNVACFLNIGRDHISPAEHPTLEDYFASKLRIFQQCENAVVNLGTADCDAVMQAAQAAPQLFTIGVERPEADLCAAGVHTTQYGIAFQVTESAALAAAAGDGAEPGAQRTISPSIAGLFNAENALCAIACARLAGIGWQAISEGLANVRVPGRMEVVSALNSKIVGIVDYAHNELSFETLFDTLKKQYPGQKLIAIFGAPGGKAHERRASLPQTAAKYADLLIFTEEDPANDSAQEICDEMAANTPAGVAHEVVLDREQAFRRAVEVAKESGERTVIAFLAKGEEKLMHRGDEFVEIKSDSEIAHEVLRA